jgi:hypothetical protein
VKKFAQGIVYSTTGCAKYGERQVVLWEQARKKTSESQALRAYILHLKIIYLKLPTFSSCKKFSKTLLFLQTRRTGEFWQFRCESLLPETIPDFFKFAYEKLQKVRLKRPE